MNECNNVYKIKPGVSKTEVIRVIDRMVEKVKSKFTTEPDISITVGVGVMIVLKGQASEFFGFTNGVHNLFGYQVTVDGNIDPYEVRVNTENYSIPRMSSFYCEELRNIGRTGDVPFALITPKKVIFDNPATIVYWEDGTKTVVKRQKGERFDKEKGLAMALAKKVLGNKGNYNNWFKEWCYDETR